MKRTLTATLTLAALAIGAVPGHAHADTAGDIGKAIHCGFLEGAGSSFLDQSCNNMPKYEPRSWDAGTYYGRANCQRAGQAAVAAGGRAKSYRCYLVDGDKYVLTLSI